MPPISRVEEHSIGRFITLPENDRITHPQPAKKTIHIHDLKEASDMADHRASRKGLPQMATEPISTSADKYHSMQQAWWPTSARTEAISRGGLRRASTSRKVASGPMRHQVPGGTRCKPAECNAGLHWAECNAQCQVRTPN